jgi:hypothetical protein
MPEKIPVFLSVGEPYNDIQKIYLRSLVTYLSRHGINAETLGRTFWSVENPLKPVQRKMNEVYGAVILALERFHSKEGIYKEGSSEQNVIADQFFTTVWVQMEAAMAYQLELPLLIMKDAKLVAEGMFDPGIHGWMIIKVNPLEPKEIGQEPIKEFIDGWIESVHKLYYSKKSSD